MPRPHAYGGGPFGGCRGIPEGEGAEESTTASARTLVAPPPAPLSGGGLLPARSISDRSCAGQSPSAPAVLPSVSSSSAPALSARPRPALRYSLMLALAADTASALLHLHANGIVHGDVKASNVLLKSGAGAGRTPSSTGASTGRAASTGPTATQSTGVPTSSTPLVPRRASQPGGGQGLAVPAASNGPLTAVGSSTELTFVTALGSGFGSDIGTSVGPETGASGGRGRLARAGERGASSAGGVPQGLSEPGNGPAVPPAGAPRQSTACGSGGSSTTRARAEDPHERLLPSGVVAKLSDFGLATHIDDGNETHVSALAAQGTLTHMAPELLLHGHISKHADTYAYGIMLYELLTADKAHRGQPRALLPHMVALKGLRPSFPAWAPPDYRALAESCWAAEPRKRPDFASILSQLQRMREEAAWAEAARPGAGGWMEVEVHALQPPSGGGGRPSSSLVLGSAEMADLMASTVAGIDAGAEAVGSG
ncbi:hypothetical protein HYH03_017920 [Edaphochlamys debaryana]|uniref:Protein kinase domain-containing protein n=1 Tax=Edaphochlamys debaryana TaxID=47281 RepID=A0A835XLF4_9CHLO|nr:hypothetical protein HYH03_017920 [Edaphochlamys debaryana]|eukprot:KAG2483185.1 hypothetical protein HYH03_017920 [Edaphochlamys debaryana]